MTKIRIIITYMAFKYIFQTPTQTTQVKNLKNPGLIKTTDILRTRRDFFFLNLMKTTNAAPHTQTIQKHNKRST